MTAHRASVVRRSGATLVELLVALVLLATVIGAVAGVMARQWRLHATLDRRRDAGAQLAAAAHVVRSMLAPTAGDASGVDASDLLAASDTLLDVRTTIGASVVCAVVDARTLELPPPSGVAPALAWSTSDPQPGDVAVVHADASADVWQSVEVDSVGQRQAGCAGSPLVRAAEAALPRLRIHLAAPLAGTVRPGAPVRFARRVRLSHYRATDGRWYLGEREWDGLSWSVTQPVAGPLRPPGTRGGLSVVARDSLGAPVLDVGAATARVRRVDVVLRADVPAWLGSRASTSVDSVAIVVALRNGG